MTRPGANRGRRPELLPYRPSSLRSGSTRPPPAAEASDADRTSANVADSNTPITSPDTTQKVPWHLREAWDKKNECPELVNWDGSWLPPPIDWHVREQFTKHSSHVRDWVDSSFPLLADYLQPMPMVLRVQRRGTSRVASFSELGTKDDTTNENLEMIPMGEIAPRYWIPEALEENMNANTFWELFKMTKPRSICDEDQTDLEQGLRRPWWQSYPSHDSFFLLQTHACPYEKISVDPAAETARSAKLRVADKGSAQAAKSFMERQRAIALRRSKKAAADKLMVVEAPRAGAVQQVRVRATASQDELVVRSAKAYDIDEIAEIYNHYVKHGCTVLSARSAKPGTNSERLSSNNQARVPFLVAIDKNTTLVLGFAYCNPVGLQTRIGGPALSLQIYTVPNRERQGVASALMDRLLNMLDSGYQPRMSNDVLYDSGPEQHCHGRFGSITVRLPFFRDDKPTWLFAWLKRLGWVEVDNGRGVKWVHGRIVDISVLQRMLPPRA